MIKEEKIIKEVTFTEKHRFCDECRKEMHYENNVCKCCGKDLCRKCIGHEEYSGDYSDVWCVDCWSKGEKYRLLIDKHENEIDQLYTDWENECKIKSEK